ncbi:hypothetical protein GCM10022197_25080 [Microlunatus spumicola]|uniref:DUF1707 domain-containing protein n=1 Tax=Microlunatus spumicola TaxID=81499 RepID=A0ABP6XJS7_9ACTN
MWAYNAQPPLQPPTQPVRIGDAERDEALDKLGDHFAAGRLTREELDERTEQAMGARFDRDLEALFRDLPERPRTVVVRRTRPQTPAVLPTALMALLPLLLLAAVASVILHVPVLIGPVVWLLILSNMGRRHHYR